MDMRLTYFRSSSLTYLDQYPYLPFSPFIFKTVETNETLPTFNKLAFGMIVGMWTIPITNIVIFRKGMRKMYVYKEERDSVNKMV